MSLFGFRLSSTLVVVGRREVSVLYSVMIVFFLFNCRGSLGHVRFCYTSSLFFFAPVGVLMYMCMYLPLDDALIRVSPVLCMGQCPNTTSTYCMSDGCM